MTLKASIQMAAIKRVQGVPLANSKHDSEEEETKPALQEIYETRINFFTKYCSYCFHSF